MFLGIQKKIDKLGRIVLPKEIRKIYHIKNGDYVEILPTENGILLKKVEDKLLSVNNEMK